jgi:hypothetical protein
MTLTELIQANVESLVDGITKDAIRQIPSYGRAPIKVTMARMERLLRVLVESVRRNNPNVLEQYLMGIGEERREHAYPIGELHAILEITEQHLRGLVEQSFAHEVERNAQLALVNATSDSARMILSKTYLLLAQAGARGYSG